MVMQNLRLHSFRFGRKYGRHSKNSIGQKFFSGATKHESFHECIEFIIGIAQYFTLLPVAGIRSNDLNDLQYSTTSLRTIIALAFIFLGLVETGLACNHAVKFNFHFTSMANLIFIIESTSAAILMFLLARRWQFFMLRWRTLENCFLYEPYEMVGIKLKDKIRRTGYIYIAFGLSEHILFIISTLVYDYFQYSTCKFPSTTFINFYFAKEKPHIFLYIPFNILVAIISYMMIVCLIFSWSFVDLFLIVISIGLITRFKQFHKRLFDNHLGTSVNGADGQQFWTKLRYNFVNLLDLVQLIDNEVAYLILLSCGSNLFTICFQIFNSFKAIPHILRRLDFYLAFFCLISRTVCVLYLASAINEMAYKILNVLRDVPSKVWNVDIQCMMDLLNGSKSIALTGRKMFIITRRIMLAMVATIITYELVIMEEADYDTEDKPVCNTTRLNFIKKNY